MQTIDLAEAIASASLPKGTRAASCCGPTPSQSLASALERSRPDSRRRSQPPRRPLTPCTTTRDARTSTARTCSTPSTPMKARIQTHYEKQPRAQSRVKLRRGDGLTTKRSRTIHPTSAPPTSCCAGSRSIGPRALRRTRVITGASGTHPIQRTCFVATDCAERVTVDS